jgi:hypothetical protein
MTGRWRGVGIWQIGGAAAAIVLALGLGMWFTRPTDDRGPVGASPTTPPSASPATATSSPQAVDPNRDRVFVYFARDGLPPTGTNVGTAVSGGAARPEDRIGSRISTLRNNVEASEIPPGATNPMAKVAPAQGGGSTFGVTVRPLQGDLATVEFDIPTGWGARGSAESLALLQQLVYTITEEPGIRRALIAEKGKPNAVIDQLVIDKPLSREDVFGYASAATPQSIEDAGDGTIADIVDWRASVDDVTPGLGRFVVELRPTGSTAPRPYPRFTARLEQAPNQDHPGKWVIWLDLPDAIWVQPAGEAFHCCPGKTVGKTPIREVSARPITASQDGRHRGVVFGMYLDDARPWRVAILHNPLRVVVDVGGRPQATSDSVAVYSPRPGETGRTVTISGFARAYEANVAWRIKDSAGRKVAEGFTMTNIGTSAVWGSFQTTATIPANVSGNVTLEVTGNTGREGADMGLVQVPLTVR